MFQESASLFAILLIRAFDLSLEWSELFPDLESWVDTLSKFIPITIFGAGTAAAVIAYKKYKSDQEAQQSANAVQTYRKYLEVAVEHPDLAEPEESEIFELLRQPNKLRKYEWFLGLLFRACEELLEHSGSDPTRWHHTIEQQLKYHKVYFKSELGRHWLFNERGIESYSIELRRFIIKVIDSP